jgi:hypothetical protein
MYRVPCRVSVPSTELAPPASSPASACVSPREDWILRGPRSSFLGPTKLIWQARTADTVLVKSREMTDRTQTLPWSAEGVKGVKTTENKIHWPHWSSPPLDPKGVGATLPCGWGGGGSQFGRLERKPGTPYSVLFGESLGVAWICWCVTEGVHCSLFST